MTAVVLALHTVQFKELCSIFVDVTAAQLITPFLTWLLRWTFSSVAPRVKFHQPLSALCQYHQGEPSVAPLPEKYPCPKLGVCNQTALTHITNVGQKGLLWDVSSQKSSLPISF